jgi:hypothetical protein
MNQWTSIPKDKPKTRPRAIGFLVVASVLVAIFTIEITVHFVPGLIPNVIRIYFLDENYQKWGLTGDKDLGFKYAPDLVDFPLPFDDDEGKKSYYPVSTVSLGYENTGFRDDGIDGETFAVVVGDSFASCAVVRMEKCWVELLEQQSGQDFANLGVISYGPQQTQRMLTKYGLSLEPNLILWVFFANDPDDAWRFDQFGKAEAREGKFWKSPIRSWLVQNSATYEVSAFFWYNRRFLYNLAIRDGETIPLESNLVWWQTVTDPTIPTVIEGFNLTQAAILEARRQTQARLGEAEFAIVIIPTREQIYYTNTILQSQLDALNENLVNFCRQHDISVIDLTPAMREAVQDGSFIYFRHDIHLNPRGHEIVAELLERQLTEVLTR